MPRTISCLIALFLLLLGAHPTHAQPLEETPLSRQEFLSRFKKQSLQYIDTLQLDDEKIIKSTLKDYATLEIQKQNGAFSEERLQIALNNLKGIQCPPRQFRTPNALAFTKASLLIHIKRAMREPLFFPRDKDALTRQIDVFITDLKTKCLAGSIRLDRQAEIWDKFQPILRARILKEVDNIQSPLFKQPWPEAFHPKAIQTAITGMNNHLVTHRAQLTSADSPESLQQSLESLAYRTFAQVAVAAQEERRNRDPQYKKSLDLETQFDAENQADQASAEALMRAYDQDIDNISKNMRQKPDAADVPVEIKPSQPTTRPAL